MSPDDIASFLAAATSGHEVRLAIGDNLHFGRPVRIEGKGVFFEARGGSGVVSAYDVAHVSEVRVLASRVPTSTRPAKRGQRA